MWFNFALGCMFGYALLIVPGYLAGRVAGLARCISILAAPVASVALSAALSVIHGFFGVPASWISISLIPSIAFASILLLQRRRRDFGANVSEDCSDIGIEEFSAGFGRIDYAMMLAACFVGFLTCYAVFVLNIGTPDSFGQNYDNAFHLNRVQMFVETGNYSSFNGGFYPSAWHAFVAQIASLGVVSVPAAASCSIVSIASVAYPLSMFFLLRSVFIKSGARVLLGSLFFTAAAYFPWRIILFGPLFPNVLAFSLMPAACAAFVLILKEGERVRERCGYIALFLVAGIALGFAQPNAIFSVAVFLAPYCLYRAYGYVRWTLGYGRITALICSGVLLVAFLAVWYLLYSHPAFGPTVTYPRDSPLDPGKALRWAMSLCFVLRRPQFLLGFIVIVGAVRLLIEKGCRWVSVSYISLVLLYVVAISMDGAIREFLVGFWYSDYHRLAAVVALFSTLPLAAGLDTVAKGAGLLTSKLMLVCGANKRAHRCAEISGSVFALVAIFILNAVPVPFLPQDLKSYGYDAVAYELQDMYDCSTRGPLTSAEYAFLDDVKKIVGEDAMVINQPFDGSVFAYATHGLHVLFTQYNPSSDPGVSEIRLGLFEYGYNEDVRQAVEKMDAKYVLQLDQGDGSKGMNRYGSIYYEGYDAAHWRGVNETDEGMPGFELVLSEGDMRLYRIEC